MRPPVYRTLTSLSSLKSLSSAGRCVLRVPQQRSLWTTLPLYQATAHTDEPVAILRSARAAAAAAATAASSVTPVNAETSEVPATRATVKAKRTNLQNPADHTEDHEGFFYTVPPAHATTVFGTGMTRQRTLGGQLPMKTHALLREHAFMIRRPALEVMDYIKKSNMSYPAIRYVLYGRHGAGKTSTLAHLLHFFTSNNWLVIHVPRIAYYAKNFKEVADSTFKPGRIDLPLDSVEWLQHFLLQNGDILKNPQSKLLTHKTYTWSKREETPAGSPLIDIVELGIKRARFANDAIGVLIREVKLLAAETDQKVAVVMDTINALWSLTAIPRADRSTVPADLVSLYCHFRSALKKDWTNGAIVTCVDSRAIIGEAHHEDGAAQYLPRHLLRGAAWDLMEPCVPILVADYKEKEVRNAIDYYGEMQWLQHEGVHTERGRSELKFLSGMNPGNLRDLMARL